MVTCPLRPVKLRSVTPGKSIPHCLRTMLCPPSAPTRNLAASS